MGKSAEEKAAAKEAKRLAKEAKKAAKAKAKRYKAWARLFKSKDVAVVQAACADNAREFEFLRGPGLAGLLKLLKNKVCGGRDSPFAQLGAACAWCVTFPAHRRVPTTELGRGPSWPESLDSIHCAFTPAPQGRRRRRGGAGTHCRLATTNARCRGRQPCDASRYGEGCHLEGRRGFAAHSEVP